MKSDNQFPSEENPTEQQKPIDNDDLIDNDFLSERDLMQFYLPPILDDGNDNQIQESVVYDKNSGVKWIYRRRKVKRATKKS